MNEDKEIEQAEDLIEAVAPGISMNEYNEIREKALGEAKARRHAWVMKGVYLVCTSCPFPHRSFIGNDKVLIGIDDNGNPILKQKVLQERI